MTLFRHKETDLTLRMLALGGFVSFSNEGDKEARDMFKAYRLKRGLIMSGGSIFYFVIITLFVTYKDIAGLIA